MCVCVCVVFNSCLDRFDLHLKQLKFNYVTQSHSSVPIKHPTTSIHRPTTILAFAQLEFLEPTGTNLGPNESLRPEFA